jgi:glycine/D-amino acid oxidase-like deaminating enzyme
MTSSPDILIIGGGIIGAACARALAREKLRVALIEADVIGGGATAAGMGHVVVMDDSEAQFALTHYSQRLWGEIVPDLPEDAEYFPCGTLWVAADEEEMAAVRAKRLAYQARGLAVEVHDGPALAEAEPRLRAGLAGGLVVPGDFVVFPPSVAGWLVDQARDQGTEVREGVAAIRIEGNQVTLSDGSRLSAGAVVCATGAVAAQLLPELPVRPRKGHLVITDRYPDFVRHQIIELGYLKQARSMTSHSVAFNVQPRRTGQLLIGSSRQFGVETANVEPSILRQMLCRGLEYMPQLATVSVIRSWAGFRAATPDKLPLIGPWPSCPGLYLATGHEGLGIGMAMGTARLLTDLILGRQTEIPAGPYLPERLADQKVGYASAD